MGHRHEVGLEDCLQYPLQRLPEHLNKIDPRGSRSKAVRQPSWTTLKRLAIDARDLCMAPPGVSPCVVTIIAST
jgi:hypothetical protein